MPRGRAWTQAEVDSLLSLVGDSEQAALFMASTSRPNEALWQEVCQGLAAAGYERTVAQCRAKWKALKQAFHSERVRRHRVGLRSALLPLHYRAMKSIWKAAGQPVFGDRRMPVVMRLPSGRRRSATRSPSSPEPPEHGVGRDTPSMLQPVKDEPESPGGEHVAGVPPTAPAMPHQAFLTLLSPVNPLSPTVDQPHPGSGIVLTADTGCCLSSLCLLGCHTDLKQEGAEGKASFPGETSLGMGRGIRVLPLAAAATGSHGTAATSEQPAAGCVMTGLLQNIQQLLVQLLYTSQQQQALLENLSHSLVQMGKTLHQLLLQSQTHPGPLCHCVPHVPPFEGGSGGPCHPSAPHTSPDHKEKP